MLRQSDLGDLEDLYLYKRLGSMDEAQAQMLDRATHTIVQQVEAIGRPAEALDAWDVVVMV